MEAPAPCCCLRGGRIEGPRGGERLFASLRAKAPALCQQLLLRVQLPAGGLQVGARLGPPNQDPPPAPSQCKVLALPFCFLLLLPPPPLCRSRAGLLRLSFRRLLSLRPYTRSIPSAHPGTQSGALRSPADRAPVDRRPCPDTGPPVSFMGSTGPCAPPAGVTKKRCNRQCRRPAKKAASGERKGLCALDRDPEGFG